MREELILESQIKRLGQEQRAGKITWQQMADILNKEFGTQLTGDACRKRYDRAKQTINIGADKTTLDIEEVVELTPLEKMDKSKVLAKIVTDPENWDVISIKISEWMQHTKEQTTKKLYAVKVNLKPKIVEVKPIDMLKSMREVIKQLEPLKLTPLDRVVGRDINKLMEMPAIEQHIGKMALEGDIEEMRINKIIQKVIDTQEHKQAGTLLVYVGSDLFNSEASQTTTKGTPQHNTMGYQEMFDKGLDLYLKLFLELRNHFDKIDVKYVPGNHDEQISFFLYRTLQQSFKQDTNIKFDNNTNKTQVYEFGECAIFSDHGDFSNGKKTDEFLKSLVNEFPMVIGRCRFKEAHINHLHQEQIMGDNALGIKVRRISSPSGTDKWHYDNRYLSDPAYQIFTWHKHEGIIGVDYVNFENLTKKKHQKVLTR